MKPKGLIVALDVDTDLQAHALVEKIGTIVDYYKVAPSMTLKHPALIPWLLKRELRVFLDCKWYDIPSQVKRSVATAGELGVTSITLHAGAGGAVMRAAVSAAPRPRVWGVTVLTSFGAEDLNEVGVFVSPSEQVVRLAKLGQTAGLDGLVCSPQEAALLRRSGVSLTLVTPGIHFGSGDAPDQKRTASPREAWAAGADYIVVGRSVLSAPDPAAVVQNILKERPV